MLEALRSPCSLSPPSPLSFARKHAHAPSGEFYTKIGTFPTFYKEVQKFFFLLGSYRKPVFFSRLNSEIYFSHADFFPYSKFYFGI